MRCLGVCWRGWRFEGEHIPGLKPDFTGCSGKAKAEALAYLEAKATATEEADPLRG